MRGGFAVGVVVVGVGCVVRGRRRRLRVLMELMLVAKQCCSAWVVGAVVVPCVWWKCRLVF